MRPTFLSARRYASAVFAVILCLSVRLSPPLRLYRGKFVSIRNSAQRPRWCAGGGICGVINNVGRVGSMLITRIAHFSVTVLFCSRYLLTTSARNNVSHSCKNICYVFNFSIETCFNVFLFLNVLKSIFTTFICNQNHHTSRCEMLI